MDEKKIHIVGGANRYQIKKLTKEKAPPKKRVIASKWELEPDHFTAEKQLSLLEEDAEPLIKTEIDHKISAYKQQDLVKKVFIPDEFITFDYVKQMILRCKLSCHYCKGSMLILYENVREMNQWSLDRINNFLGHNVGNVVISCLKCNLNRRNLNSDKFLFTKQMTIVRKNLEPDTDPDPE
jgi:hypothetical protein